MCGIFFAVSSRGCPGLDEETSRTLSARGPDSLALHHDTILCELAGESEDGQSLRVSCWHLTFASSVLSLRGDVICPQPLVDEGTGSVFCWNGEAWKIDGIQIAENDSQVVFASLLHALAENKQQGSNLSDSTGRSEVVTNVLTNVTGPYAFVFYDAPARRVYYGRDPLGRRSLVSINAKQTSHGEYDAELIISSFDTTREGVAAEVPTTGIQYQDLHHPTLVTTPRSWPQTDLSINKQLPITAIEPTPSSAAVRELNARLSASLRLRLLNIPTYNTSIKGTLAPSKLAVLYSGGLDCTLLARLSNDIFPPDEPIDLLNVAFENPRTVRAAAEAAKGKKDQQALSAYEACPDRLTGRSSFLELSKVCPRRVWRFFAINIPYTEVLAHRSTIIRLMRPHNTEMDLSIAMALYFAARGQGCVTLSSDPMHELPSSFTTARVLLSGLGADELFGGYARHAAAYSRAGWAALNDELELDFKRIGSRNLGRDDRVIAHWAREVRYPYLDEDFVKFVLKLPAWEKCGFRVERKILKHFEEGSKEIVHNQEALDPAKMLLRCLAWQMGVPGVAAEKKRAIQFGARTAKMEVGRTKGTDTLKVS